jgi:hypothetical protein
MPTATLTAEPCVRCGTTGGFIRNDRTTPYRSRLDRFGFPGRGCFACYSELYRRSRGVPPKVVWSPPDDPEIDREELEQRIARVRAVKDEAYRAGRRRPKLTQEQLDAVLPDGSSPAGGAEGGPS